MVAGSVREHQGAETRNNRDWRGAGGRGTSAKGRDGEGACSRAVRGACCDREEEPLVSGPHPKDSLMKG